MFLSDLLLYAKEQARIEFGDYCNPDPRFHTADEVSAWRLERSRRDSSRAYLFSTFPARLRNAHKERLIPGYYGRLKISYSEIRYTIGQYAPAEIYDAVLYYMKKTNY